MATTNMRIVIRRDTYDNWFNNGDVVLLQGEQGYETDRGRMKIGVEGTTWADLPYFAGGITGIDGDTIIMDASGKIMLNSDSVIGNLGDAENVKDYVDTKDDALAAAITAEAAAREAGDTALGARIDALTEASENGDTTLAADLADSVAALVAADEFETSERLTADGTLQVQISLVAADVNSLDQKVEGYKGISDQGDISLGLYVDSVDAKFGSMTAPGQAPSATVTDFVGLVTGNLGGVNVKTYSDNGDSVLGAQISALQDMDTVLGSQINERVAADAAQDARLDALELDSVTATDLSDSVTALLAADAVQDGRLDALELDSVTATDLSDSVTALLAADAVQDGRLDALEADTISGGTGVTITNGEIAIGQDVATSEEVTFSKVTATNGVYADLVNAGGDVILDVNTGAVAGNASGVSYLEYNSGTGGDLTDLTTAANGNFAVDTNTSTVHIRVTGGWVQISN